MGVNLLGPLSLETVESEAEIEDFQFQVCFKPRKCSGLVKPVIFPGS